MMKFSETLRLLRAKEESYQKQLRAILDFTANLSGASATGIIQQWMVFQVYFLPNSDQQKPIKTENHLLSLAYQEAKRFWLKYNGNCKPTILPFAHVLVRINQQVACLSPVDAAQIASSESGEEYFSSQFTIDDRLIQFVGTNIWSLRSLPEGVPLQLTDVQTYVEEVRIEAVMANPS